MNNLQTKVDTGVKIFACNGNRPLAEAIAKELGLTLGNAEVGKFSDGEIFVKINEIVRGADVYIIQPTSNPVNDNLMELLIMVDALRRASAGNITAVVPYYGYARQDRKARDRDPISARLVADLIQAAGTTRLVTMDLHCDQLQGFFTIPVDHMVGKNILSKYYIDKFGKEKENICIVSPDLGSVKRTREMAEKLEVPLAIIDKRRPRDNVSEIMNIIGEVEGKIVVLVDDMIDTAGTICNAAQALRDRGAKQVCACCTHPVLSGPALERIAKSEIDELVVLDTINNEAVRKCSKIKVLSVASVFANAINRIHSNESISELCKANF